MCLFLLGYTSFFHIHFSSTSLFYTASFFLTPHFTNLCAAENHIYISLSHTVQHITQFLSTAPIHSTSPFTWLSPAHSFTHMFLHYYILFIHLLSLTCSLTLISQFICYLAHTHFTHFLQKLSNSSIISVSVSLLLPQCCSFIPKTLHIKLLSHFQCLIHSDTP